MAQSNGERTRTTLTMLDVAFNLAPIDFGLRITYLESPGSLSRGHYISVASRPQLNGHVFPRMHESNLNALQALHAKFGGPKHCADQAGIDWPIRLFTAQSPQSTIYSSIGMHERTL